ncbi:hypothetical protein ABC270_13320 [Curtobacterium sp. 1P10AnD]|uniref:phage terminase small subunit n=1 Tax=Curtobacterium sp. 1P10AnD TaxID=3132283 RepID=UPI0039A2C8DA
MPGRGPAPKAANKRARRNAEPVTMRILPAIIAEQPELPTRYKSKDEEDGTWRDEVDWPIVTVRWWAMWRDSPLAAGFTYNLGRGAVAAAIYSMTELPRWRLRDIARDREVNGWP